jgi:hypothetical protein
MNAVPDLRAECKGIEAQVAQMLRVVAGPVPDPAGVAMLRMQMAQSLGAPFDVHVSEWPLRRIGQEWERFRIETCAVLVSLMARHSSSIHIPERRAA